MKVIQTNYRGFKFRSRLEARWAVFFDTIGTKWEYEPEGFDLGKLGWYLPDFYVYEFADYYKLGGSYFEIKPDHQNEPDTLKKLEALSCQTNKISFLLNGPPDFKSYKAFLNPNWCDILFCHLEYKYLAGFTDMHYEIEYSLHESTFLSDYVKAVKASRAARFEHNETPDN